MLESKCLVLSRNVKIYHDGPQSMSSLGPILVCVRLRLARKPTVSKDCRWHHFRLHWQEWADGRSALVSPKVFWELWMRCDARWCLCPCKLNIDKSRKTNTKSYSLDRNDILVSNLRNSGRDGALGQMAQSLTHPENPLVVLKTGMFNVIIGSAMNSFAVFTNRQ